MANNYNQQVQDYNEALNGILAGIKELPEYIPPDERYRRWDVTITGAIVSNYVFILQDDWLKAHRAATNLCVTVLPKSTIEYTDSSTSPQGIYLCTNSPLMMDGSGTIHKGLSAYMHRNGNTVARTRKYGLTNANDMGDLLITAAGQLQAVVYGEYVLPPGEYCVVAFLM